MDAFVRYNESNGELAKCWDDLVECLATLSEPEFVVAYQEVMGMIDEPERYGIVTSNAKARVEKLIMWLGEAIAIPRMTRLEQVGKVKDDQHRQKEVEGANNAKSLELRQKHEMSERLNKESYELIFPLLQQLKATKLGPRELVDRLLDENPLRQSDVKMVLLTDEQLTSILNSRTTVMNLRLNSLEATEMRALHHRFSVFQKLAEKIAKIAIELKEKGIATKQTGCSKMCGPLSRSAQRRKASTWCSTYGYGRC